MASVFDGTVEMLERLKADGYKLGIITSKTKAEYEGQFLQLGIGDYFDTCVFADETSRGKPSPEPMYKYIEKTGAKKEEIIYTGDTNYDMDCARACGVSCALALWGCINPDETDADYKLSHPLDILKIV